VLRCNDAGIKGLVAEFPVWQDCAFRSATTILLISRSAGEIVGTSRGIAVLKRPFAMRGRINLAALLCYYSAARSCPGAQLLILYFPAPEDHSHGAQSLA